MVYSHTVKYQFFFRFTVKNTYQFGKKLITLYEEFHRELENKIKFYLLYLASELITYLIGFKLVMVLNVAHFDLSGPGSSWPGSTPFAEFL